MLTSGCPNFSVNICIDCGEILSGGRATSHAIALANRSLMALAGLWENWRSPAGEWVRSFAIVTTAPNELCAELHNRMTTSWAVR